MGLLEGKVALITGAGRGIGAATARRFAAEGARVVVNDLGCDADGSASDPELARALAAELCEATGDKRAVPSGHDVADPDAAALMVALAVGEFGRLDILVNNAGVALDETLMSSAPEHRQRLFGVLVDGAFRCMQESAHAMRTSKAEGSIINTTGLAGLVGNYGQAAYSAAAAALYGMTRAASIELQRHGIRVNAVCPVAKTRLTEHLPIFDKMGSHTPEHVAPVHVFLASHLSRHVSGQVLSVAGGRLSTYRVQESAGAFKDRDGGIWTAEGVAEGWSAITKA